MQKRILIILLGAIGDVVRALPLAVRIKSQWPDCHLTWAVEPKSKAVLENFTFIDELIVFERHRGFAAYLNFVRKLRAKKFNIVIDLQRHLKSGVTSFLTRAKKRIGFHPKNAKEFNWIFNNSYIPPVENFSQKIWHYQLFGDRLELEKPQELDFGLTISPNMSSRVNSIIKEESTVQGIELPPAEKRVCLILGSTWQSRFWLVQYYQELIAQMYAQFGLVSLLIGAKSEEDFANQVLQGFAPESSLPVEASRQELISQCPVDIKHLNKVERTLPILNLVGKTSLNDLFVVFNQAKCAIGSDSGPMHIAAAMGIPVISLWGSTSPKRSAPYKSERLVIKAEVPCSPCYKKNCPGLGNICMKSILPREVLSKLSGLV